MYQILVVFAQPTLILFLVLGLAIANLWRKRQIARGPLLLVTIPYVVLMILCIPAVSYLAKGTLEWPYPPLDTVPDDAQAIVILSGYLLAPDKVRAHAELGHDTLYRCQHGVRLHQKAKRLPILVSGGSLRDDGSGPRLGDAMRDFLVEQGVSPSAIWVENRSQSTYENALECSKILQVRGIQHIVLVTDAEHMRRSLLCFRKQGITVTPAACNHVATKFEYHFDDFVPNPRRAGGFERVFHEWLGIAYYWVLGRL